MSGTERLRELRQDHSPRHGYACWPCRQPNDEGPCTIAVLLDGIADIEQLRSDLAAAEEGRRAAEEALEAIGEWDGAQEAVVRDSTRSKRTDMIRHQVLMLDLVRMVLGDPLPAATDRTPPSPQCKWCPVLVPVWGDVCPSCAANMQAVAGFPAATEDHGSEGQG